LCGDSAEKSSLASMVFLYRLFLEMFCKLAYVLMLLIVNIFVALALDQVEHQYLEEVQMCLEAHHHQLAVYSSLQVSYSCNVSSLFSLTSGFCDFHTC